MLPFSRRGWLQALALGATGFAASSWLPAFARELAKDPRRKRRCILLWMTGGPSQMDTWDLKPGHKNGGEFKEIATSVPGLKISEHLPKLAAHANDLAILRGVTSKEGDHGRGTYLMHTGHAPMGTIQHPTLGASLSKELGDETNELPNFVSIAPYRAFNQQAFAPGFLGPKYAPLTVAATDQFQIMPPTPGAAAPDYAALPVDDLAPPSAVAARQAARLELWRTFEAEFVAGHAIGPSPVAHQTVYERAVKLMNSEAAQAFDLSREPKELRDAYGRGRFGQGCLMARRLIERGVAFVELSLGTFGNGMIGWDTHGANFKQVKDLSAELDAGFGTLLTDLKQRGLLEETTILWMGEFGRTPTINPGGGRDHYPNAASAVLAGGGIAGGQAYGRTGDDGVEVVEGKTEVGDLLATLCTALGVPPTTQHISEMGRPLRIAEGEPIKAVLR